MAATVLCASDMPQADVLTLGARHTGLRGAHAADRMLFLQSDASGTQPFPQSDLARDLGALAHTVEAAAGTRSRLAPALDAALLDEALLLHCRDAMPKCLGLAQGHAIAFVLGQGQAFPANLDAPDGMVFELLRSLDAPISLKGDVGGVAVVTADNWSASAEAVGVVARSAALAQLCASAIEKSITRPAGELSPEVVWDVLGAGARVASALRAAGHLRGAVLTFRGRGRVIGPLEGDRLLRFGVSNWR